MTPSHVRTDAHTEERPVRLSATTTVPMSVVWTVGVVLAAALLYGGRQLQRLDTIEQQVRDVREDVRSLLLKSSTTGR